MSLNTNHSTISKLSGHEPSASWSRDGHVLGFISSVYSVFATFLKKKGGVVCFKLT